MLDEGRGKLPGTVLTLIVDVDADVGYYDETFFARSRLCEY